MQQPPPEVFDLFAVPDLSMPLDDARASAVRAGDLVLSPDLDAHTADWLNPILARLSVRLDDTRPRTVRIAMPIPARDLRWVVHGWGASRYEPAARACHDLDVLLATGRLLHAHLATAVPQRPDGMTDRRDRWAQTERAVFDIDPPAELLGADLAAELAPVDLGPDQLVHGDLARNVLLDAAGHPLVIDVAPYWRPALWAEALCVLDAVLWLDADPAALREWTSGARRQAMLRAALFRMLTEPERELSQYRALLAAAS